MEPNLPFEGDPIIEGSVISIMNALGIRHFVETGTYLGSTSGRMAELGFDVRTIESNPEFASEAVRRFGHLPNWRNWKMSSDSWLRGNLLPHTKAFYYLDAHWGDDWPLLDELRAIGELTNWGAIAIHDFKVPDEDFGFDTYKDQPLDLDYIKPVLEECFDYYRVWFNEQALGAGQGVCYIVYGANVR